VSRSFNGLTDSISLGSSLTLMPAALSICFWVNPTSLTPAYSNILNRMVDNTFATNGDYAFYLKSSGKLAIFVNNATGRQDYDGAGTHTLTTGSWWHIGFSCPTSGNTQVYVNGVSDGGGINGGNFATTSVRPFLMGFDPNTAGRFFSGAIADLGVWNVALTAQEINSLATGARPFKVQPKSLAGWLPLDGLQSPEPDLSGNINNGTLTGTSFAFGPPVNLLTRSPGFIPYSPGGNPQSMLKQIPNSLSAPDGSEYGTLTDGAGTLVVTSTTSTGSLKQIKNSRIAPDGSKYMTLTDGNGNLV